VAAAAVPVAAGQSAPAWATGGLGALIVVVEGIQQLFQLQPNWSTYRSTCEALKHEKFLYLSRAGHYASAARPEALLSERVESLVSQEHAAWSSAQEEAAER
jgi:predicted PhzF superfamily epimerase YddE/YHI9